MNPNTLCLLRSSANGFLKSQLKTTCLKAAEVIITAWENLIFHLVLVWVIFPCPSQYICRCLEIFNNDFFLICVKQAKSVLD